MTIPLDFAEGVVLRRLTEACEAVGTDRLHRKPAADVAALRASEADLIDRLEELGEAYAGGEIERATMRTASTRIKADLGAVQRDLAEAGRSDVLAGVDAEALYAEFDYLDLDRQRAIVCDAFARIVLLPRGRGRSLPRSEHVVTELSPAWTTV